MKIKVCKVIRSLLLGTLLLSISSVFAAGKVVILSTNDMHGQIERFPKLMAAVKECRDTAEVILVDAGDKWTGNSYVDLVENYAPIFELMNYADYDFSVFGNHEFDKGQGYLNISNKLADFPTLGANVISDTTSFEQPEPYMIIDRGGVKIAFVGVVGNYNSNNHPAGKDASFKGLTFIDPKECAASYAYIKDKYDCDLLVLVTHMGQMHDTRFANSELSKGYDMVIGGHSHDTVNKRVNGIQLSQTGYRLNNVGATSIEVDDNGVVNYSYRNIPLDNYKGDHETQKMVNKYYQNPELATVVGSAGESFNATALRNLFATAICEASGSDLGFYHCGGIRRDSVGRGAIKIVDILDLEPFSGEVCTMEMTTEQLEKMILTKYNDRQNLGEAHYLDLIASLPYTVFINKETKDGVAVIFPTLKDGVRYKVAVGDYIYETYKGIECENGTKTGLLITEVLKNLISSKGIIYPDSVVYQKIK